MSLAIVPPCVAKGGIAPLARRHARGHVTANRTMYIVSAGVELGSWRIHASRPETKYPSCLMF
eukprot:11214225-Lingulodinium_polyedra.AAC.1